MINNVNFNAICMEITSNQMGNLEVSWQIKLNVFQPFINKQQITNIALWITIDIEPSFDSNLDLFYRQQKKNDANWTTSQFIDNFTKKIFSFIYKLQFLN